jgi:hypothetical protein
VRRHRDRGVTHPHVRTRTYGRRLT